MHPYLDDLQMMFMQGREDNNARAMKKYMKDRFEYFGIKAPRRREIMKAFLSHQGMPDYDSFEQVVYDCWSMPEREFQYFAMEMANRVAKRAEICRIDLYEYMIMQKSWWDTVDYIASNLVGVHFRKFPDTIGPYTQRWLESGNLWLQRTVLLFQLKYRKHTDLDLLTHSIEELLGSHEFFIDKAIGWILRGFSKTDPAWVLDYVRSNETRLAPLSKREALKWIQNKKNAETS